MLYLHLILEPQLVGWVRYCHVLSCLSLVLISTIDNDISFLLSISIIHFWWAAQRGWGEVWVWLAKWDYNSMQDIKSRVGQDPNCIWTYQEGLQFSNLVCTRPVITSLLDCHFQVNFLFCRIVYCSAFEKPQLVGRVHMCHYSLSNWPSGRFAYYHLPKSISMKPNKHATVFLSVSVLFSTLHIFSSIFCFPVNCQFKFHIALLILRLQYPLPLLPEILFQFSIVKSNPSLPTTTMESASFVPNSKP